MIYNLTGVENAEHFPDLVIAVNNDVTHAKYAMAVIIIVALVLIIAFRNRNVDMRAAFVATTFIISVIASLMWIKKFVPWQVPTTTLVLFVASLIYLYVTKDS